MAYKNIDATFKLEVVQTLWSGMNYTQVSDKYDIPRATIYRWEQTAKEAIVHAFEHKTPGKKITDVEEENQRLKEQIQALYHAKHKTAQERLAAPTPVICSKCGSSHIKKNGTVLTKKDGLRQRYSCTACSWSIYVDVKKTLLPSG